jgi:predicted phosphodiesterase
MKSRKVVFSLLFLAGTWLTVTVILAGYASSTQASDTASHEPPPNFKVAFIADSDYEANFEAVLNLIKSEQADFVLHQGDFDYSGNPAGFFAKIDAALGTDFPYLGIVGNHDVNGWPSDCGKSGGCYTDFLQAKMAANNIVPDDPNLDDEKYAITYQGLRVVFVGQNGNNVEFAQYLTDQLAEDNHIWKICSWHRNQKAMQIGGKTDQMGWDVYNNCLNLGAIIATGHEHTYERTRTLINAQEQIVDPECPLPDVLCVEPGKTFVFVSGLGGKSIRDQSRCFPTTFPYGCNQEWASIYTSDQAANYGALFITFHVDGDPHKARGYFKNIDGELIDEFVVYAKTTEPPPPPPEGTPFLLPIVVSDQPASARPDN